MSDSDTRHALIAIAAQAQGHQSELAATQVPATGFPPDASPEHVFAFHLARAQYLVAEAIATGTAAIVDALEQLEGNP